MMILSQFAPLGQPPCKTLKLTMGTLFASSLMIWLGVFPQRMALIRMELLRASQLGPALSPGVSVAYGTLGWLELSALLYL